MTRDRLLILVRESRKLIKTATPQQKIELLKLIREGYRRLKENTDEDLPYFLVENEYDQTADYLEEK
jgi:hypothetical protein